MNKSYNNHIYHLADSNDNILGTYNRRPLHHWDLYDCQHDPNKLDDKQRRTTGFDYYDYDSPKIDSMIPPIEPKVRSTEVITSATLRILNTIMPVTRAFTAKDAAKHLLNIVIGQKLA